MIHFGIISPPVSGHIHPMSALGRELVARGHRVSYLQVVDLRAKIEAEGLEFVGIGESDHGPGTLPVSLKALGQLEGLAALRFTIQAVASTTRMVCRDAPAAIAEAGIQALLVDQMEPAGGAVAEHLGLPFVTICNALAINRDPIVPPPFTPWSYRDTGWARLRNRLGYALADRQTAPITRVVSEFRAAWGLPRLDSPDDSFSKLAQICQMPREFDFPRSSLPRGFHYVGPLRRQAPREVAFPWDRLDGRPMIYASLGTLQNNREPLFRMFAAACERLDAQLVVSHGGGLTEDQARSLPGGPLVVPYAPQEALLARARLTLTHAGLNTVLDSLSNGVPVVAVPITYEQPAIARRIEWCGAGSGIPFRSLSVCRLESEVRGMLEDAPAREGAVRLSRAIEAAGGVRRAADLVEATLGPR